MTIDKQFTIVMANTVGITVKEYEEQMDKLDEEARTLIESQLSSWDEKIVNEGIRLFNSI